VREETNVPQNIRNFWVIANADGRATPAALGPRAKDGGIDIVVLMREDGGVSQTRLRVHGAALYDGTLSLTVSVDGHPEQSIVLRTNR